MPRPTIAQLSRAVHTAVLDVDERTIRADLTEELRTVLGRHGVDCNPELSRDLHLAAARSIARASVAFADVAAEAVRDAEHGATPTDPEGTR